MGGLRFAVARATTAAIVTHLMDCDARFVARLRGRRDIAAYAAKIHELAVTFEAWSGEQLVGLVAAYLNDSAGRNGYITSVSVIAGFQGRGLASKLMRMCIDGAREKGFKGISLEVDSANDGAIRLYRRLGFQLGGQVAGVSKMTLVLAGDRRDQR